MYSIHSSNLSAICCLGIILGCIPCPEHCRQYAGNCMDFGWWCQLASSATGEPCLDVPAFHSCCRHQSGSTIHFSFFGCPRHWNHTLHILASFWPLHLGKEQCMLQLSLQHVTWPKSLSMPMQEVHALPAWWMLFEIFLNVFLALQKWRKDLFLHCRGNLSRRCPEWAFWVIVYDESPICGERSSVHLKLWAGYFDNAVRRLRVGKEEDWRGAKSHDIEEAVALGEH